MIRLFFALFPDPATAARIERRAAGTRDRARLRARPLPAERLHVTLYHIDDYTSEPPPELVESLRRAAADVSFRPFEVAFDRVLSFGRATGTGRPRANPFVLTSGDQPALQAFRRTLGEAMVLAAPTIRPGSSFTPHVTLFYETSVIAERPVAPAIGWTVQDFALVKSFVGESRYQILGRWPARPTA